MKLDIKDLKPQLLKLLGSLKPLVEHMQFLMVIVALGFMIFAVYSVTQILQHPTDTAYRNEAAAQSVQTSFDEATIRRIENLRASDQSNPNLQFAIPITRANPFSE